MKIAEFFAELGVKGSEKTIGALSNVKKGFGEITNLSLEAKAGMVAALYAFERFMAASGQAGTNLTNFTALTNLSAQTLQEYQYAARQAGVSNEELTGSLKSVQGQMTNMLLGKGAPEGLGLVASTVGFDPNKARDTFYVMQQLQAFAKKVPADVGNQLLKSFGLSDAVIAAMRRNVFRSEVFKNAPKYSKGQMAGLDASNRAFSNLGTTIAMAFGEFNAAHGTELVKDITDITKGVIALVKALEGLAEKMHVFEAMGKAAEFIGFFLKTDASIVKALGDVIGGGKKGEQGKTKLKEIYGGLYNSAKGVFENGAGRLSHQFYKLTAPPPDLVRKAISPPLIRQPRSSDQQKNIEVNQTLNFQHDGKDHKKVQDSHRKGVQDAFRQLPQGQGG